MKNISDISYIIETTAIRKIAAMQGRYRVIYGTQGAGKKWGVFYNLIKLCCEQNQDATIFAPKNITEKKLLIGSFKLVMKRMGILNNGQWSSVYQKYTFRNGKTIEFVSEAAKRIRTNIVYIANNETIDYETFWRVTRCADVVFIGYEPDEELLGKLQDVSELYLTHKDNEAISEWELNSILSRSTNAGEQAPIDKSKP